jgi:hypothetical protein
LKLVNTFDKYETGGIKLYHIKQDKRSIQSSNWIYHALINLLEEKEYTEITIKELVNTAKLGRATFYRNFDSIDDVLRLKCDEAFKDLYEYIINCHKQLMIYDPNSKFILLKPFFTYWYDDSSIIEQLIKANKIDILNNSFINMLASFSTNLDIENKGILKYKDYFVVSITALSISILVQWIKDKKNIEPDALYDIVTKQIFNLRDLLVI